MNPSDFQKRATAKMARSCSSLAPLFCLLATIPRIRNLAIRTICQLEGGQMWSVTYRLLMNQHFGVEIGIHSYGPCLRPGVVPPRTKIGNYCSLAAGINLLRRNHPTDRISQHPFFFNALLGLLDQDSIPSIFENPLTIGHDVWIGQNVVITPNCHNIGNSAVIASGAVVTSDVPAFAIMGGVPAKLIRYRLPEELRMCWLESKWWLKPITEHAERLNDFTVPFNGQSKSAHGMQAPPIES